jgi:polyether ionophore transport system ATP-binding protein
MVVDSPAIRTEGLTKRFGEVVALDRLDLAVERGEVFGFLGPNGAGKTTTIRLLLHLIHPTAGRAWVMGIPVEDVARAHRHVGYVAGDIALWPQLTGLETLQLLGTLSGGVNVSYRDELLERLASRPSAPHAPAAPASSCFRDVTWLPATPCQRPQPPDTAGRFKPGLPSSFPS